MPVEPPGPLRHSHPLAVIVDDLRQERASSVPFPPGETNFSLARAKRFFDDPRRMLVECYERFGPIFTLRLFSSNVICMVGPAANHYVTVANATNFTRRESQFRTFISMIGDGILTTDGDYHRSMRRIVLPPLHQKSFSSYFDTIVEETETACESFVSGRPVDVYAWARELVLRLSLRTLFGIDPDGERARAADLAGMLRQVDDVRTYMSVFRGPFTAWARLMRNVRKLDEMIYAEIAERRARGTGGTDIMGMLIDARDEEGEPLTDRQVRDETVTLLLGSRDTTSSGITFLLHQLALHRDVAERVTAEQETHLLGGHPTAEQMTSGELVELESALDETLRMYPPLWIGMRRSTAPFEFEGVTAPGNAYVDFFPIASHYLPEVFPEPERFMPERFTGPAKAAIPRGGYMPFGAGSRICVGKRFAQLEITTIATLVLKRFELKLPRDFELQLALVPVLAPKEGVPMIVRERAAHGGRVPIAVGN